MKKPLSSKIGGAFKNWNTFLVVLLVLEFVVFGFANEKFLRIPLLLNSINDFIAICLISLFVTFVMITGGIDIQAGSIVGLTSIVIGVFWQDFGLNIWGAVLLAVAIAAVCGALSGFFVAYCGVQAMVVTLGGQFLYAGPCTAGFHPQLYRELSGHQRLPRKLQGPHRLQAVRRHPVPGAHLPGNDGNCMAASAQIEIRAQGVPCGCEPTGG